MITHHAGWDFEKNIYVILTARSSMFAANVRKTSRKWRSCAVCHPGASESMQAQLIWCHFAPGWEFHPGQDRWAEFTQWQIFFSFLVVNTGRSLTTHRIDFNPGLNSHQGEILVVNRPLSKVRLKWYLSLILSEKRHLFKLQRFLFPLTNTHYSNWFIIIKYYDKMLPCSLKEISWPHTHTHTHTH